MKKNTIQKTIICILLCALLINFLVLNNKILAEEAKLYQKVVATHDQSGIAKNMIENNYELHMQIEKNVHGYILYSRLNSDIMNNYVLSIEDKTLNTVDLKVKDKKKYYATFLAFSEIAKSIEVKVHVPAMGKDVIFNIQLTNFEDGIDEKYEDIVILNNKPGPYYYEYWKADKILLNNTLRTGKIKTKFKDYEVDKLIKINNDGTKESLDKNIHYQFHLTYNDDSEKEYNILGFDVENFNKIDFSNVSTLIIEYSYNNDTYAKTRVTMKYILDKNLSPDTEEVEEEDYLPNHGNKKSVNVMALSIGITMGVLALGFIIFVTVLIVKNRKFERNKKH